MKPSAQKHIETLTRRYPALLPLAGPLAEAVDRICASVRAGGKLLLCGNGGSAADAEHIVGELMKSFGIPRPLPVGACDAIQQAVAGAGENEVVAQAGERLRLGLQRGVPAVALSGNTALATAIANDTDPLLIFAQQVYALGRPGDVLIALSTSGNSKNVIHALLVARAFGIVTIGFVGRPLSLADSLCDVLLKAPAESAPDVQEFHLPLYHALCLAVESELFG